MTTRDELKVFVTEVQPTLQAIEAGDLSARVREPARDTPLGALAAAANALAAGLSQARERTRTYQQDLEGQIATIEKQVQNARDYCTRQARAGVYPAGCPVQYSRDARR